MSDIETKLQHLVEQQQQLQQLVKQQMQQNSRHFVKLPELVIPTFDGNKLQWREFWELFQVTVDKNDRLSEIEKFCYLKSKLTGVAKQAISGIFISTENYEIAKQLLDDRFNDREFILHHNLREVMNLTPAHNNPSSLRLMYDKLESHLRCLEGLKQDINTNVFKVIIKSKIPEDIMQQLNLQKGNKTEWSVKILRESLNNYIHAMETAEHLSFPEKTEYNIESSRYTSNKQRSEQNRTRYQPYIVQCRFCDGNHWSDQCTEYPTIEDRKVKVRDSCYLCLKKGHIAFRCQSYKQCVYCGHLNHHHRSLCPKKFPTCNVYETGKQQIMKIQSDIKTKQKLECDSVIHHNLHDAKGTTNGEQSFGEDEVIEQQINVKSEILKLNEMVLNIKEQVQNLQLENKDSKKQINNISTYIENIDISDKLDSANVVTNKILRNENALLHTKDLSKSWNTGEEKTLGATDGIYKYSKECLLKFRVNK